MESYKQIFERRGQRYNDAMTRLPDSRQAEFGQLLERVTFKPGAWVADVPAGGGYLRRYLPDDCQWHGHEPCSTFSSHLDDRLEIEDLLPLPWEQARFDICFSLAGVHHLQDKRPFYREVNRILKPDGVFVLSDVKSDTPVASFLNGFVDRRGSTGHNGVFLNKATTAELEHAGFTVESRELVSCPWRFTTVENLRSFCGDLFDLEPLTEEEFLEEVGAILRLDFLPDNSILLQWELLTYVCRKPA